MDSVDGSVDNMPRPVQNCAHHRKTDKKMCRTPCVWSAKELEMTHAIPQGAADGPEHWILREGLAPHAGAVTLLVGRQRPVHRQERHPRPVARRVLWHSYCRRALRLCVCRVVGQRRPVAGPHAGSGIASSTRPRVRRSPTSTRPIYLGFPVDNGRYLVHKPVHKKITPEVFTTALAPRPGMA